MFGTIDLAQTQVAEMASNNSFLGAPNCILATNDFPLSRGNSALFQTDGFAGFAEIG